MDSADGSSGSILLVIVFIVLPVVAAGLGLVVAGRLESSRSVLVHAPASQVWEFVRHFPTLHARHGKSRDVFHVARWELLRGNGDDAGTVWRAVGTWEGVPYWVDVELAMVEPEHRVAITLRRDSLGTEKGLRNHLGSLTIDPVGPDATKVTWRLCASLRGPRLVLTRVIDCSRLQARLFDQGLRSLKVEIDRARQGHPPDAAAGERPGDFMAPVSTQSIPPETTV